MEKLLTENSILDIDNSNTKWKGLNHAFINWQNQHQCSNHILKFIQSALTPVRYIGKEDLFHFRRHELNKLLSFIGIELNERENFKRLIRQLQYPKPNKEQVILSINLR